MLQYLNIDGIRTIGSVLGQSIALDYYVRQVMSCLSTCNFKLYVNALWFWRNLCSLGWWNCCRIYWHQSWDGENWNLYNGTKKALSTRWKGKFKSCWCNPKAWAVWEVLTHIVWFKMEWFCLLEKNYCSTWNLSHKMWKMITHTYRWNWDEVVYTIQIRYRVEGC